MTAPMCEDSGPLREWAPLAMLLQRIPAKVQNGLFTQDINFTCIDAVPEFIAIGTNHGLVYWFDRQMGDLQRLRCENMNCSITCLRVISTVDYMVAAGNNQGIVTIFQIPKQLPDSLPDNLKPKTKKQVERYNISGLHKSPVTTVEWSKNGMKLFSGDNNGLVVLTEMDFYMHLSKSSELLNEKYSVVQLSYRQGLLLVSTVFRTILVDKNQNDHKVTQVGQKERKTLGKLGAVFSSRHSHVQEPAIYVSRPGLRLWQADKNGTVLKTLVFKDAMKSGQSEVALLNPAPESSRMSRKEPSFGIIKPFSDNLLVTFSEDIIFVVNPNITTITSVVTDLRRVTDVACCKDEIFILEGERNIIRISYHPEMSISNSGNANFLNPLSSIAQISKPVTSSILELTSKLKESSIVPAIPFHKIKPTSLMQSISILPSISVGIDTTSIVNAEEAVEVPPIVPLDLDTPLVVNNEPPISTPDIYKNPIVENEPVESDRRHIFEKISEQAFEDVVFTPERRQKKQAADNETTRTTHSSLLTLSIDNDFILKPDRNIDSIRKDVENKEKLLAGVLNFDLSEYMTGSRIYASESTTTNSIENITYLDCSVYLNPTETNQVEEFEDDDEISEQSESTEDASYKTELKKLKELGECSKEILKKKLEEPWLMKPSDDLHCCSSISSNKSAEAHFNALSKEFITSNYEDTEDWVMLG